MSQFDDRSGAVPPPDPEGAPGEARPRDAAELEGPPAHASEPVGESDGGFGPTLPPPPPPLFPPLPPPHHVPLPQECLHKKVVIYWLLSGLISWLFLSGFLAGGAAVVYFKWPEGWRFVLPATTVLVGTLLVWTLISPSLAWARWRFSVDEELLLARYGIFFIEEKAIPISRLQHVDLYRGLLERFFGLTTLIVFTAGTEGAHFRLPGLGVERARELRDVILAARGDDVI